MTCGIQMSLRCYQAPVIFSFTPPHIQSVFALLCRCGLSRGNVMFNLRNCSTKAKSAAQAGLQTRRRPTRWDICGLLMPSLSVFTLQFALNNTHTSALTCLLIPRGLTRIVVYLRNTPVCEKQSPIICNRLCKCIK